MIDSVSVPWRERDIVNDENLIMECAASELRREDDTE